MDRSQSARSSTHKAANTRGLCTRAEHEHCTRRSSAFINKKSFVFAHECSAKCVRRRRVEISWNTTNNRLTSHWAPNGEANFLEPAKRKSQQNVPIAKRTPKTDRMIVTSSFFHWWQHGSCKSVSAACRACTVKNSTIEKPCCHSIATLEARSETMLLCTISRLTEACITKSVPLSARWENETVVWLSVEVTEIEYNSEVLGQFTVSVLSR